MARYFTLKLYFHSSLTRENKLACSWNILLINTYNDICVKLQNHILSKDISALTYEDIQELCNACSGTAYSHIIKILYKIRNDYMIRLLDMERIPGEKYDSSVNVSY